MKRIITLAFAALIAVTTLCAQPSRRGAYDRRGYNPSRPSHPSSRFHPSYYLGEGLIKPYFGLRVGPTFSNVSSDDPYLDGSGLQTGVNVGCAVGFPVSPFIPLYFESGLYYTEKGGTGKSTGNKFTYKLDYLELPFVFKYDAYIGDRFSIQPFVGGYAALGVGGKIKDFGSRQAYSSFSSDSPESFRRGDAGLKFGCGFSYSMLYFDVNYDLGLTNISHDGFDTSHNRALTLNFGLTF